MLRTDDIHNTQRIANAAEAFLKALGAHFPDDTLQQLFRGRSLRRAYWIALQQALERYATPDTTWLARSLMRGEVLADPAVNAELMRRFLLNETPDYALVAARWAPALDDRTITPEALIAEAQRLFDVLVSELQRQGELRLALQRLERRRRMREVDTTITVQQDVDQLLDTAITSGPRTLQLQVRHVRTLSAESNPAAPGLTAERLLALAALGGHLGAETLTQVWDAAERLADPALRVQVLAQIAPHLAAAGLIDSALDLVHAAIHDGNLDAAFAADVLLGLIPHLGAQARDGLLPSFQQRLLNGAQSILDPASRVRALGVLIEHLPHEQQSEAVLLAFEAAISIPNDMARATALSVLPPHLPAEFQGRLLSIAHDLRAPEARALLLGRMIPSLPPSLQASALTTALEAVARIGGDDARASALIALAPYVGAVGPLEYSPQGLEQALEVLFSIERADERARAFAALAPFLAPELLDEALPALRSIADEEERAATLARLAPHLPPELQLEAFADAHELALPQARAVALATIAPYLPAEARAHALADALDAALAVPDAYERVMSLVELTPHFVQEHGWPALAEALETARGIRDEGARARALVFLAPHLVDPWLGQAVEAAYGIRSVLERVPALAALMPHLTLRERERVARDVLEWARAARPPHHKASLLAAVALVLPDALVPDAVTLAARIETPYDRLHVLAALLPRQPGRVREAALEAAQEIPNRYQRVNALLELVPHVAPEQRFPILDQALGTALGIEDDYDRASALANLAPYVGSQPAAHAHQQDGLQLALDVCLDVPDLALRAALLARLALLWVALLTPGQSYRLWRGLVTVMRTAGEAEVMATLAALSPVIEHMGAPGAASELAEALRRAAFEN